MGSVSTSTGHQEQIAKVEPTRLQTFVLYFKIIFCVSCEVSVEFCIELFLLCLCLSYFFPVQGLQCFQVHWENMAGKNKRNQAQKEEDHLEDSEEPMSKGDFNRMIAGREADGRAEEERAEARLIAAEERAEKRRKAEKIEEEERAERRAEARLKREREEKREADERAETRAEERAGAKRQRKLEEARVAAELEIAKARAAAEFEAAKEAAAKVAAEKLMEQQQAMADRQFKQQEQLMKLQAEISATAANERRLEQEMSKKRDRAVLSIGTYKDS